MVWRLIPPLSFFRKTIFGGSLFNRNPKPSNSCSINFLCWSGLRTSRTMKISEHVRATAITWRPRPFPSFAPSMIPGRSSSWNLWIWLIAKRIYWSVDLTKRSAGAIPVPGASFEWRLTCIMSSSNMKTCCTWILAPLYLMQPGTVVSVVNS